MNKNYTYKTILLLIILLTVALAVLSIGLIFHLKQLIIVVQIFMNGQLVVEIFMVDKQKIVVLVQVEKVINS